MPKANTTEYKRAFVENNYSRISVTIPKEQEAAVKAHAEKRRLSVNGLINELLRRDMGLSLDAWKGKEKEESAVRVITVKVEKPKPQKPLIIHYEPKEEPKPEFITFKLKKEE